MVYKYQLTYITVKTVEKYQWYNVQITSNGSSIFVYVDGVLEASATVEKGWKIDSVDNLYVGSMAQDNLPAWGKGEFNITGFRWYLKYFTKDEVINNYINNKVD